MWPVISMYGAPGSVSGTLPAREYSEQELKDAISLIEWLSTQPWSTGSVGMYGHSWSGFNAIQVAIRHPSALKTIVAQVSTEDLYHEGERFPDGIFHFDSWNAYADLLVTTPEGGKPLAADALAKRFDQPPWTLTYSHHPHDDAFWRPEIRVDKQPQELTIPIMMLGGWFDGYRNAIYRALGSLHVPMKAIVGPWNHRLDNPGPLADLGWTDPPLVGFLAERQRHRGNARSAADRLYASTLVTRSISGSDPRRVAGRPELAPHRSQRTAPVPYGRRSPVRGPVTTCHPIAPLRPFRRHCSGYVVGRSHARPTLRGRIQPGLRVAGAGPTN